MRRMVAAERFRYSQVDEKRREGRVCRLEMGRWVTAIFFLPAWMIDSRVYVNSLTMLMRSAASRLRARKPLVASGTLVPETFRTTHEPSVCKRGFGHEKW